MHFFNRSYLFFCFFFSPFCNFFAKHCKSMHYEMLKNHANLHNREYLLKIGFFWKKNTTFVLANMIHIYWYD